MPVRALTAELAAKAASEEAPHKNVREAVEVVRQSVSSPHSDKHQFRVIGWPHHKLSQSITHQCLKCDFYSSAPPLNFFPTFQIVLGPTATVT